MSGQMKFQPDAITTLMSTELNSLANGSNAIASSSYANATNLNFWAGFELNVTFGSAPTANNTVDLYLVPVPDGTNADDGSASVNPPYTCYVGSFPLRAVTTAQKIPLGFTTPIILPPVNFFALVINNSGVAFPASGSTLKMVAAREQYTS